MTYEEFKGRKPIVRNGLTLPARASDFDNPFAEGELKMESGGTTGLAMSVNQNLEHLAVSARYLLLMMDAHGLMGVPSANWTSFFPSGGLHGDPSSRPHRTAGSTPGFFLRVGASPSIGSNMILRRCTCFCRYDSTVPRALSASGQARTSDYDCRAGCTIRSRRMVAVAPCECESRLACGSRRAASRIGLDRCGDSGGAEPLTPAKSKAIRALGGSTAFQLYHGRSESADHLLCEFDRPGRCALIQDGYALFYHPHQIESARVTVPAFNLTSLLETAPKVLFNYEADDYGIVEERQCGCVLEDYGYTTHIRQVRSYTKLVGEGVTLIGNEIQQFLEELLPARFGGARWIINSWRRKMTKDSHGSICSSVHARRDGPGTVT